MNKRFGSCRLPAVQWRMQAPAKSRRERHKGRRRFPLLSNNPETLATDGPARHKLNKLNVPAGSIAAVKGIYLGNWTELGNWALV